MVSSEQPRQANENGESGPGSQHEEFKPTVWISIIWTVLATVMTIAGFLLFTVLFALLGGGSTNEILVVETESDGDSIFFSIQFGNMLLIMLLAFGVLVLHEAVHGAAFRFYGGRPTFGATVIQKILPAFYCSAPGYRFTRGQFAVIILAPLVVISMVGVALMPFVEDGLLLVLPLAINFGGAVGDVWMAGMLVRRRPGTMIEDLRDGLRFYPPAQVTDQRDSAKR